MALDIEIDQVSEGKANSISLYYNEYNLILDRLQQEENFPILKRCLSDYFGEYEIFLNELRELKSEVDSLKKLYVKSDENTMKTIIFLNNFSTLIGEAIKLRKTLKFIGD